MTFIIELGCTLCLLVQFGFTPHDPSFVGVVQTFIIKWLKYSSYNQIIEFSSVSFLQVFYHIWNNKLEEKQA